MGNIFMLRGAAPGQIPWDSSDQFSPNHIQSRLRSPETNMLAVTAKSVFLMFDGVVESQGDMNQAYRLVHAATGRTGNSGDPHANGGPCFQTNPFSQTFCNFWADRSIHLDQQRWNAGQIHLSGVAITGDATEKIAGTTRHTGDPLGNETPGATLRHR